MTPYFIYFEAKESDEIVSLMIRCQLLPQKSPKGNLMSFLVKFSA